MQAGEAKQVDAELADDSTATIDVTVKEIKEKVLPPLDDELARKVSEFDSLEELRNDVERTMREHGADVLIDCVNTASGISYQDVYTNSIEVRKTLDFLEARIERRGDTVIVHSARRP